MTIPTPSAPARCPPHYSLHNNKCYSLKGVPKGAASSLYMQGLLACSGEGAALAFPEDEQTLLFLADLARVIIMSCFVDVKNENATTAHTHNTRIHTNVSG